MKEDEVVEKREETHGNQYLVGAMQVTAPRSRFSAQTVFE